MAEQLTADGVLVKRAVELAYDEGLLTDADTDWADDRRSDGMSAVAILLELLARAESRKPLMRKVD